MLGTWIDFNTNYGVTIEAELAADLQAIKNSIHNILSTPIGSRPMQRAYGSMLYFFLQQPRDRVTAEEIRVSVIQAIETWEPRVTVDHTRTSVVESRLLEGFDVEIFFSVNIPRMDSSVRFVTKRI